MRAPSHSQPVWRESFVVVTGCCLGSLMMMVSQYSSSQQASKQAIANACCLLQNNNNDASGRNCAGLAKRTVSAWAQTSCTASTSARRTCVCRASICCVVGQCVYWTGLLQRQGTRTPYGHGGRVPRRGHALVPVVSSQHGPLRPRCCGNFDCSPSPKSFRSQRSGTLTPCPPPEPISTARASCESPGMSASHNNWRESTKVWGRRTG